MNGKSVYSDKELFILLKDSYHKIGDIEKYQYYLRFLLINGCTDINLYHEYKNSYLITEWSQIEDELIKAIPNREFRCRIYNLETRYPELMATISHIGNLDLLDLYQDILKDSFLVDIISLYKNRIRSMSEEATGRPQYQTIVTYLGAMLSLENVEDVVVDFIEELMVTYSRRPAMKEELTNFRVRSILR